MLIEILLFLKRKRSSENAWRVQKVTATKEQLTRRGLDYHVSGGIVRAPIATSGGVWGVRGTTVGTPTTGDFPGVILRQLIHDGTIATYLFVVRNSFLFHTNKN